MAWVAGIFLHAGMATRVFEATVIIIWVLWSQWNVFHFLRISVDGESANDLIPL